MSIKFQCEHCGHPMDVDDRLGGKHGRCKHCGHALVVPQAGARPQPAEAPLKLRPMEPEGDSPHAHLLSAPAPLKVRPAEAEPRRRPEAITDVDEPPPPARKRKHQDDDYNVLDPYGLTRTHSSAGPPPRWTMLPSLTARFTAGYLRSMRDWLYVVSIAFLVMALIGFLFKWKLVLHLAAAGVIATNIGMLVIGLAYLVTLPFKESLLHGLANFIPFYAFYYWATRWKRMRTPVYRTLGSFLPIALVGLGVFLYEEAPVIEKDVIAIERKLEGKAPALEKKVDELLEPVEKRVGPILEPEPDSDTERNRRPAP